MKRLRKPRILRILAVAHVLLFLQSVFAPMVSMALTHGRHQPEYTAYEEPDAVDMVNLLTGDFNYNIPLLHVPSPEGGFSMPMSYHSGIGAEQQSSWVGLGFNMNPGAINRNVSGFYDDASGESQLVTVKDPGIRGWTMNLLFLGRFGWNSEQSHFGQVSLDPLGITEGSWGSGSNRFGVAGVTVGSSGFQVDQEKLISTIHTVAHAIGTQGTSLIYDVAIRAGAGAVSGAYANQTPSVGLQGYWKWNKKKRGFLLWKEYDISLDQTRAERMYGTLNLHNAPVSTYDPEHINYRLNGAEQSVKRFKQSTEQLNYGAASDIYYHQEPNEEYKDYMNPSGLAYDDYSVSGQGISGTIKPYRLETGSVSVPREMSALHSRVQEVPYEDYKVNFVYENAPSTHYFHHVGGLDSEPDAPVTFESLSTEVDDANPAAASATFDIHDYTLESQRLRSERPYFKNNQVAQSNFIQWHTNDEIRGDVTAPGSPYSKGFIDFLPPGERDQFRLEIPGARLRDFLTNDTDLTDGITLSPNTLIAGQPITVKVQFYFDDEVNPEDITYFDESYGTTVASVQQNEFSTTIFPELDILEDLPFEAIISKVTVAANVEYNNRNKIGGYSITRSDGVTFHYALPVYDFDNYTEIVDKDDSRKINTITRKEPFASAWLLTAITGSDFLDRNENGTADAADWGQWVRFHYGKYSDGYRWRDPYMGTRRTLDGQREAYSEGLKQLYYLNRIETRTHTALFFQSERQDGYGANANGTGIEQLMSTSRLDDIYLLRNEDFQIRETELESRKEDNVYSSLSLSSSPSLGAYLADKQLQRTHFEYDYSLGYDVPNNRVDKGKLTLKAVAVYGRNNFKLMPDYTFHYEGSNPLYHPDSWDGWGMYSSDRSDHQVDDTPVPWHLTRIVNPMQSETHITYERDDYSAIGGIDLPASFSFTQSFSGYVRPFCGVSEERLYLENSTFHVGDIVSMNYTYNTIDCHGNAVAGNGNGNYPIVAVGEDGNGNYIDVYNDADIEGDDCWDGTGIDPNSNCAKQQIMGVTILKIGENAALVKKGGNVRVKAITTTDERGNAYTTAYSYKRSSSEVASSSGVVSREPEYVSPGINRPDFYDHQDWPTTPVLYSRVEVTKKTNHDPTVYTRKVYEFVTPDQNMIRFEEQNQEDSFTHQEDTGEEVIQTDYDLTVKHFNYDIHTAEIGSIKRISVFDQANNLITSDTYVYEDQIPEYQGVYTEGTLMHDVLVRIRTGALTEIYHNLGRTTKIYHPNILKSVTSESKGLSSTTTHTAWDFFTGAPTKTLTVDAMNNRTLTERIPAYTVYPTLGPKALDVEHKNNPEAIAATYAYKLSDSDTRIGLLNASAATFSNSWDTYRMAANGSYTDAPLPGHQVWHQQADYTWKGAVAGTTANGSYGLADFVPFDFSDGASNEGWQLAGTNYRYDQFSHTLEAKDLSGRSVTSKMDLARRYAIVSATNAGYTEVAYAGAEEQAIDIDGQGYEGGEVRLGSGTARDNTVAHTGRYSLKLTAANQKGYHYKVSNTDPLHPEFNTDRDYRALVWVHANNDGPNQMELYYRAEGASLRTGVARYDENSLCSGSWCRLELIIPQEDLQGATSLEVGARTRSTNTAGYYIDDFRFQPVDATAAAYVYDHRGRLVNVLNDENMYIRYQYGDDDRLTATSQEVPGTSGEQLISRTKVNYAGSWGN